jgi:hypothetical protein
MAVLPALLKRYIDIGWRQIGYKKSDPQIPVVKKQLSGPMYFSWVRNMSPNPIRRYTWELKPLNNPSNIGMRTFNVGNKFTKITNIPGNYYQKNGKYLGSWSRKFYKKVGNGYQLVNKSEINKLKTTGGSPIGAVGGVAMTRPGNVVRPGANGFTTRNVIGNSGNYERQYWNGRKWRA